MGRCVLCGAGGYYAFEVNTFSHSIFIFAEVLGKSLTRPIFFKRLHSFIAPFYLCLLYVNFTVQSSTLYVVDLSPPIRQGLGSLVLQQQKKTRLPSSTSEMLDKMTLIPNPNAENTARSQLHGEKKNCLPVRSRFVPTPTRNNHTANTTC